MDRIKAIHDFCISINLFCISFFFYLRERDVVRRQNIYVQFIYKRLRKLYSLFVVYKESYEREKQRIHVQTRSVDVERVHT